MGRINKNHLISLIQYPILPCSYMESLELEIFENNKPKSTKQTGLKNQLLWPRNQVD